MPTCRPGAAGGHRQAEVQLHRLHPTRQISGRWAPIQHV